MDKVNDTSVNVAEFPPEDFNPLDDEGEIMTATEADEDSEDDEVLVDYQESPNSSLDSEVTDYLRFATTPPNHRAIRRNKDKMNSPRFSKNVYKGRRSSEKEKVLQKSAQKVPLKRTSSISEEIATPISVSNDEKDDFLSSSSDCIKRRTSGKNFNRIRRYDRDLKQSGNNLETMSPVIASDIQPTEPVVIKTIKVDTPNRFLSLNSKQVSSSQSPEHPGILSPKRQLSFLAQPECPKERQLFHKTFSLLIKMGNSVNIKKEKESRYVRQMSSEQEVWQNKLNDLIWLNLQAWHHNRTVKDQDEYLYKARENIESTLKRIMSFTFKYDMNKEHKSGSTSESVALENDIQNTISFVATESSEFIENSILNEMPRQKEALHQVEQLLEDLENAEKLYPTLKAMRRAHPLYASEEFTKRVGALCMWLNITRDLIWKLQLIGNILRLGQRDDQLWPYLEFDTTFSSIESIRKAENVIIPDDSFSDESCTDEDVDSSEESEEEIDAYSSTQTEPVENLNGSMEKNVRFALELGISSPSDTSINFSEASPSTSTPIKTRNSSCMLGCFSSASLDEQAGSPVYRYFAERMLKKTGMRKMHKRLQSLLKETLSRAREALVLLNMSKDVQYYSQTVNNGVKNESTKPAFQASSPSSSEPVSPADRRLSFIQMGPDDCAVDIQIMGLPSFKSAYLFLARIPLDVVHECILIRLEQMGETEPSLLSIRQLIRECKEVLNGSVVIKQFYKEYVGPVLCQESQSKYETDLEAFEKDMKLLLGVYLKFIQSWMSALQVLPEASKRLKGALEDEWNFTQNVCPHVQGGEAQAGNSFCRMASGLLESISHFLDSEIDDCVRQLYDSTMDNASTEEDCNHRNSRCEVRQGIMKCCRHFKILFHEARERASKAVGFAKMLRKDLEIAAAFHIAVSGTELLVKLQETNHVRVKAPHSAGYMTFVPFRISSDKKQILKLLNISCGREDSRHQVETSTSPEGYLLLVRCEGMKDMNELCPIWKGDTIHVEPNAETTIALSHIAVEGLLLVVHQSSQLGTERKEFEHLMMDALQLTSEQTSCHQAIAESLSEMKSAAMELKDHVAQAITQVDEKLNLDDIPDMEESERYNIMKLYRETLQQCYNFGFEYHKELTRLVSGELRNKLAFDLVSFAQQWMKFVSDKCERGRGKRPRWASQGLEFLIVACDPRILALLSDQEFSDLKSSMNNCINHVVGDRYSVSSSPGVGYGHINSPDIGPTLLRFPSWPEAALTTTNPRNLRIMSSEPSTPKPDLLCPAERFAAATKKLERKQTNLMFRKQMIGRVISQTVEVDYHTNIPRVSFKWQRGNKIGEGQFGKVYTAVNTDTGDLMAMKEIRFQPNDHQTIKDIADEIKIFDGIKHESLVKYFGVELHRDEMLIFMEFCDHGTIEVIAGLGLDETVIRKYTKEILVAINVLHENGIVHRDIKGANIFLVSGGPLKLGDFGCAVKLKHQTTMPGEVNTLVGTTAFMAPEVITRNTEEGSGRAADIWSLGCVIIEMATGKRPWAELENNMQIMFKVGMGATPSIPESLSSEGREFLSHCFEMDPKDRWTAIQLLDHPFVKVYNEHEDDDS